MTARHRLSVGIDIEVEGAGVARGELKRYLAPMTFDEIVKKLPIDGVAVIKENTLQISINVDIMRGSEKQVSKISRGDILYWPANNSILIPLEERPAWPQSVKIGSVQEGLLTLSSAAQGSRVKIKARD
jgi:hypothetical protein